MVPTLAYRIDLHSAVPLAGDPTVARLPVDQFKAQVRLIPKDGGQYRNLDEQLAEIIIGLSELLNEFLREANIPEVDVKFIEVGTATK